MTGDEQAKEGEKIPLEKQKFMYRGNILDSSINKHVLRNSFRPNLIEPLTVIQFISSDI